MDAKKFREKIEALYKDVDVTDRRHDDKALIRDELASITTKNQWATGNLSREKASQRFKDYRKTDAYKESHAKSIKLAQSPEAKEKRLQTLIDNDNLRDSTVYDKIYEESWTADRGESLYKKLAKKYEVPLGTIVTVVNGTYVGNNKAYTKRPEHDDRLQQWRIEHGEMQWWWKIYDPSGNVTTYDRQADANRFICEKLNKDHNEASGIAFALFKHDKPKTKMTGIFQGWRFEKVNRKTNIVENRPPFEKLFAFDLTFDEMEHIENIFVPGKGNSKSGNCTSLSEQYKVSKDIIRMIGKGNWRKKLYWL